MKLRFVPADECRRIVTLEADPVERATVFADACRLNALYMIERAGSALRSARRAVRDEPRKPGTVPVAMAVWDDEV